MIRPPALMFGIPIADVTMDETIDEISRMIDDGRRHGRTSQIATVNVDFLVNALDSAEIRSILQHADLCLADGMPLVWGARALRMPIRERVAGSDLVPLLAEVSRAKGWRVHVFGSAESVAARARALVADRYPDALFSIDPGPMIADVETIDEQVLDDIAAVEADILCVALGNPKQERFIRAHRDRLGIPVLIGVGGSLDMMVGERRRAPRWMQRAGLEWVARAVQEPRRLGPRYAHDIRVFGPRFVREWRARRSRLGSPALQLEIGDDVVHGRLTGAPGDDRRWVDAVARLETGASLRLEAGAASPLDDAAAARIIGLVRVCRRRSGDIGWVPGTEAITGACHELGVPPSLLGLPGS